MNYYVDVILPLPLKGTFTYELSQDEFNKLEIGFRVAVSFGKRKIYTGIVNELHNNKPESYETKPIEWMSINEKDVPEDVRNKSNNFFERLVTTLHLKNMFFSGPDFYKWDNNVKIIDCNPRIGQGLQQMDDVHNNTMIPRILQGKSFDYKKQIYWVMSNLKPGRIKSIKDFNQ